MLIFASMMIEKIVSETICRHELLSAGEKVIVALSGGADSVCLLRLLLKLGYSVVAAHCNFHLRGEESDRDEAFVRDLCRKFGVELFVKQFDTRAYSSDNHVSIEMAARELRYQWFEKLRMEQGATNIVVAHHEDDVAETLLMNLVRGTGIQGVSGIAYRNGNIVRPMLDVSRADILAYLGCIEQSYVTDSTNLEDDCKRNIVRLNIIPELRRLNPSASHSIAQSARRLAEVSAVYNEAMMMAAGRVMEGQTIIIERLLRETAPRSVLYECLKNYGFTSASVETFYDSLVSGESGRMLENGEWRVLRDRGELIIARANDAFRKIEFDSVIETVVSEYDSEFRISRSKSVATLDADKLRLPLSLRYVCEGDRFHPFGMRGTKLLSDFLTDLKFSRFEKERQMVVVDATGAIVWVVGERSDNRFRVDEKTKRIVELRLKNIEKKY